VRSNLVAALALVPLLAGCASYQRLASQEVVVHFAADAPQSDHAAARAHCSGYAGTTPEPAPSATKIVSVRVYDVRFVVTDASDAQLASLLNCLRKQPGVVGVDVPEKM
jgi:hypothetical protein